MATAIAEETKSTPEFLPRIIGILNDGMLCLALSIGHRQPEERSDLQLFAGFFQ